MKTIAIKPIGKPRMTQRDKWAKRPCVLRYREFCDEMRKKILIFPIPLYVQFNIAMPPSWPDKKKQAMLGTAHKQKPDIDNLSKAVMDALLQDDSIVDTLCARKVWALTNEIIFFDDATSWFYHNPA